MPKPIALITGASSGIGAELARVFAANGHELVLVARSADGLATVADAIAATGKPHPQIVTADLGLAEAGAGLAQSLASLDVEPAFVVNNAGFGLLGLAAKLDRTEQLSMLDLNVRTLTDLSLRFVPSLAANKGGLLNVASVAGFLPGAGQAVYYASKAYVVSFTEALGHELAPLGIRVTALCPGPVATGFQARAGVKQSSNVSAMMRPADRVAREGYDGLMAGKRVVVPGFANKLVTMLPRFLPRATVVSVADARRRRTPADGGSF